MVEYERVVGEEKEKEKTKEKKKGLLERLLGKRAKHHPSKLEKSEDSPNSASCTELEAKTFIESEKECSQIPSPSSENTGIEGTAASILSKYFTCRVCNRNKIIEDWKGEERRRLDIGILS